MTGGLSRVPSSTPQCTAETNCDNSSNEELTWLFELRHLEYYQNFCVRNRSRVQPYFPALVFIFATAILLPANATNLCVTLNSFGHRKAGHVAISILSVIFTCAISVLGGLAIRRPLLQMLSFIFSCRLWTQSTTLAFRSFSNSISSRSPDLALFQTTPTPLPSIISRDKKSSFSSSNSGFISSRVESSRRIAPVPSYHAILSAPQSGASQSPAKSGSTPTKLKLGTFVSKMFQNGKKMMEYVFQIKSDIDTPVFICLLYAIQAEILILLFAHVWFTDIFHSSVSLQIPGVLIFKSSISTQSFSAFSLAVFLSPYLIFTSVPIVPVRHVWFTLLCSAFVIIAVGCYKDFADAFWLCTSFFFMSIGLTLGFQMQLISDFFSIHHLRSELEHKERTAEEEHVTEMRHMIANVAHDLKTPLASFMGGIECIQLTLNEAKEPSAEPITSINNIDIIQCCLSNIRSTHAFMLMTINRCIDYTKASKGLVLIPKHETMHLLETIQLPLNCMLSIQNRVDIVLNPIPPTICSCVITDKQWLQENILCLLSNAVKYSVEGEVRISISLVDYVLPDSNVGVLSTVAEDNESDSVSVSTHSDLFRMRSPRSLPTPRSKTTSIQPSLSTNCKPLEEDSQDGTLTVAPFLRIEVEDSGIGMSEEGMKLLFNPFKQTQRLAGGTGLGLYSLAKRLEALKGYYGVMGRRDGKQGSLFWLAFPYKPDRTYAQHIERILPRMSTDPPVPRSPRLLVGKSSSVDSQSTVVAPLVLEPRKERKLSFSVNSAVSTAANSIALTQPLDNKSEKDESGPLLPQILNAFAGLRKSFLRSSDIEKAILAAQREVSIERPSSYSESSVSISLSRRDSPLSILLVDDSAAILKMSSMMLRRLGHSITTADNGAVAVKLIMDKWNTSRFVFDVVLMDLQMPVMDGLEATRRIRTWERDLCSSDSLPTAEVSIKDNEVEPTVRALESVGAKKAQVIVGMSANSDHETTLHALDAGANAFLPKPFNVESIRSLFSSLLTKNNACSESS